MARSIFSPPSFPLFVVVTTMVIIYRITVFHFIDRRYGLLTSPGIINAFCFTCLAALTVYSYACALFIDPGRVPPGFTINADVMDNTVYEVKRKDGNWRYCRKCLHYKPPRAHHCGVCNRCVLRMDHHCRWINSCLGHANYKFFLVFMLYALATCIYSLVILTSLISSFDVESRNNESEDGRWLSFTYATCLLLIAGLIVFLCIRLYSHIEYIRVNRTCIEMYGGVRRLRLPDGREVYDHPYDLGAETNSLMILGPTVPIWIWPTARYIGSGLRFPTIYDNLAAAT